MLNELSKLMKNQNQELKRLLQLLEIQKNMIMNKDNFGLEEIVEKINDISKIIAQQELQRRKLTRDFSINEVVNNSGDKFLKENFENLKITLKKVIYQKETNELLLKQGIIFTNKMLSIMTPKKDVPTYNSYGGVKK